MIQPPEAAGPLFSEARPETSKCSRSGKFQKTLTGFHPNENQEQQGTQPWPATQNQMNTTGFNFRQNRHQESRAKGRKPLLESQQSTEQQEMGNGDGKDHQSDDFHGVKEATLMNTTSSGFNNGKRQSSFSKGITLEQYFHTGGEETPGGGGVDSSINRYQQSFQLNEICQEDSGFRRYQGTEEGVEEEDGGGMDEEGQQQQEQDVRYQDEFEIHEESDEEEEEEIENKRRRKKKIIPSASSSKQGKRSRGQDQQGGDTSNRLSRERQKENDVNSSNSAATNRSRKGQILSEKDNEQDMSSSTKSYQQRSLQESIRQPRSLQESQQKSVQESARDNAKGDDFIQKKIRDKYFKKTIHKPIGAVPHQAQNLNGNSSNNQVQLGPIQQQSSTSHTFYSSQQQGQQASQNNPSVFLYSGSNQQSSSIGRKTNRSQSPLQAFKRSSNLQYTQQRCLSKDLGDQFSGEDDCAMMKTFNSTMRKLGGAQQQTNLQSGVYQAYDSDASIENHIAFRSSFYSKGQSLVSTNYGAKQRLTINDFYKHPGGKMEEERLTQNQLQLQLLQQQNQQLQQQQLLRHQQNYQGNEYLADVVMMRRTAKENKFLNHKDKIQEMVKEDEHFITKHAARFNLNPSERTQFIKTYEQLIAVTVQDWLALFSQFEQ